MKKTKKKKNKKAPVANKAKGMSDERTQSKGGNKLTIPGAKPYLDIYADVGSGGTAHMNIVTETLYNQYKEKSRKYIIQQQ